MNGQVTVNIKQHIMRLLTSLLETIIKNNLSTYINDFNTMVHVMGSTSMNGYVTVNITQHMGLLTGLNHKE